MKKFLNLHYALIVLALGIAVITIYAKTNRNQQTATKQINSAHSTMTVDSSISSTSSKRRTTDSTASHASRAPSQMRELLMPNFPQEKRAQLVARFEKWNEQDVTQAIEEWKSYSKQDQLRVLYDYLGAYSGEWTPSEQHWNFLKSCLDHNDSSELITNFAHSCFSYNFALVLERLLLHMAQTNPVEAKSWFKKNHQSSHDFTLYIFFQENTKKLFGINYANIIVMPQPTQELPEINNPFIVK